MAFVPYVPPAAPSPGVNELTRRLREVIERFRLEQPDVTTAEIRQAATLSTQGLGGVHPVAIVGVMLGLAGLILAGLFAAGPGLPLHSLRSVTALVVAAGVVIAAVLALLRGR